MVEDHDRIRGELEIVADVVLAVILRVGIPVTGRRVEAQPVPRVGGEGAIRAGIAVPVAEVDQDVGALRRRPDLRPRGIRAVELGDRGTVGTGQGGVAPRVRDVLARAALDGADDDDDLQARRRRGCRGDRQATDGKGRGQRQHDQLDGSDPMTGRPLGAWFLDWQRSCLLSSGTSRGDAVTVEVAAGGRDEDAGTGAGSG